MSWIDTLWSIGVSLIHPVKTLKIAWFEWRVVKVDEYDRPIKWWQAIGDCFWWPIWGW